jgi:hypothetical protein
MGEAESSFGEVFGPPIQGLQKRLFLRPAGFQTYVESGGNMWRLRWELMRRPKRGRVTC